MVVYKFTRPRCNAYIGITEENFYQRCYEDAALKKSAFHAHIKKFPEMQYLNYLSTNEIDKFNCFKVNIQNTLNNDTTNIHYSGNLLMFLIGKAFYMKFDRKKWARLVPKML